MLKTLKAKETRTEIYTYNAEYVNEVRISSAGNSLLLDGESISSCCLNCINPRCMLIRNAGVQCTMFKDIAGSVDMHVCPSRAISIGEKSIRIDETLCSGCGLCARACPVAAIEIESGIAKVNIYSGDKHIKKLSVTDENTAEQERFLAKCENASRQGIILYENDSIMKNIQKYVNFLNQDKQNIFVRNILILLGNYATVARKGNVYMRLDGFYQNQLRYGVLEVETGSETLDVSRAILDDIAVLNSRHGISKNDNKPLAVCLSLPNKRTDYWQVVKDIKDVTGIKIQTITIGALLIMLWNNLQMQDFLNFYIDVDNTSIREVLEEMIGRKVQLSVGTYGILENEK